MLKALILTGDAAETLEVFYPCQRLQEEGYEADIAAPAVKKHPSWMRAFIELLRKVAPVG